MSTATAQLLAEFDRLSPDEQREFSNIIVRRAAQIDYGDITEEELTASAATVLRCSTRRRMPSMLVAMPRAQ